MLTAKNVAKCYNLSTFCVHCGSLLSFYSKRFIPNTCTPFAHPFLDYWNFYIYTQKNLNAKLMFNTNPNISRHSRTDHSDFLFGLTNFTNAFHKRY